MSAPVTLRRGEVAALFKVRPHTISEWDRLGKFPPGVVFRTPGGQRRFKAAGVMDLMARRGQP